VGNAGPLGGTGNSGPHGEGGTAEDGFAPDDTAGHESSDGSQDVGTDEDSGHGAGDAGPNIQLDASPDAQDATVVPDGGNLCTSDSISFVRDTMPVFQRSCTLSSVCHGQMNNSGEEDLYLGLNFGGGSSDVQAVYDGLVGVAAKEDPSMNLVTKGDLENSYLWHKVNDDQTMLTEGTLASGCAQSSMPCPGCSSSSPCGATMPYLGEALATFDPQGLCAIQNWILQGAQNN
jgi:hypothetical protein